MTDLSPSQSGLRRGRRTAEVVSGFCWLCVTTQRQHVSTSGAPSTPHAVTTCLVRCILSSTSRNCGRFTFRSTQLLTSHVSQQAIISRNKRGYAARRQPQPYDIRCVPRSGTPWRPTALATRPPADVILPLDVEYSLTTRTSRARLIRYSTDPGNLRNSTTSSIRHAVVVKVEWHMTRQLGWSRRRHSQKAAGQRRLPQVVDTVVGHCGWTLWFRRVYTSLQLRRRLCVSYVVPVLMYTIGTREEQNIFTWMSTVIVVYARSSAAIGLFVYRTRHCTTDADANHERWRHNSKIEHAVQQAINNVPGPTASISADGVERRPASRMSYVVCYVAASTSTRNCHIRKPISDTLTLLGNRSTLQTPLFYHWGGYKHSESRWVK